jgi:hypothetical protein
LAMVEMNLVHLLERNSGSAQFSPASNTTEQSKNQGWRVQSNDDGEEKRRIGKRTFFVPKRLLCLFCFEISFAIQPAGFNIGAAGWLTGHEQHTISWDLLPAHEFDYLTGFDLRKSEWQRTQGAKECCSRT